MPTFTVARLVHVDKSSVSILAHPETSSVLSLVHPVTSSVVTLLGTVKLVRFVQPESSNVVREVYSDKFNVPVMLVQLLAFNVWIAFLLSLKDAIFFIFVSEILILVIPLQD